MNITDVFFDLDHTLWDFEKNSALAFRTILEKHKVEVNHEQFLQHYVPLNLKYWERYRTDSISQEELRYGRLKDTFDLLRYDVPDQLILKLSEEYIEHLPQYNHLFDGAVEVLEYLKGKYRLHIITNGFHQIQERKLLNSNILHFFDTVTNSESAGVKKPNPIIFEHAMKVAKTNCSQSVMIGDCIDADARGALKCGMNAILFDIDNHHDGAEFRKISKLRDLKSIL